MTSPRLPLFFAVLLIASCGPESPPQIEPMPAGESPLTLDVPLNGTAVTLGGGPSQTDECRSDGLTSGSPLPYIGCHNGPLLSGTLDSVNLSGVTLAGGQPLDGPAVLTGAMLGGTAGGVAVQGADFVGASFTGKTTGGSL